MIFVDKTTFTSAPIDFPYQAVFEAYVTVTGPGTVSIEMLEEDGVWRSFPETTITGTAAQVLTLKRGKIRVVISGATATTVELRT